MGTLAVTWTTEALEAVILIHTHSTSAGEGLAFVNVHLTVGTREPGLTQARILLQISPADGAVLARFQVTQRRDVRLAAVTNELVFQF